MSPVLFPAFYPRPCPAGKRKVSKAADKRRIKRAPFMARGQWSTLSTTCCASWCLLPWSCVVSGSFGPSSEGGGLEQGGSEVSNPGLALYLRGRQKAVPVSVAKTLLSSSKGQALRCTAWPCRRLSQEAEKEPLGSSPPAFLAARCPDNA